MKYDLMGEYVDKEFNCEQGELELSAIGGI